MFFWVPAKPDHLPFRRASPADEVALKCLFNNASQRGGALFEDYAPDLDPPPGQPGPLVWLARDLGLPVAGGWILRPAPRRLLVVLAIQPGWEHLTEDLLDEIEAGLPELLPELLPLLLETLILDIAVGLPRRMFCEPVLSILERRYWRAVPLS